MRFQVLPKFDASLLLRLSLTYLLFTLIAGVFLAEVTLHPGRRVEGMLEPVRVGNPGASDVAIAGQDGAQLRAWSIRPTQGNGNSVILLHGLGDNRAGMTGYAELFLNHGFSVLFPDARAHGQSGGNLATFGLLETDDIRRWIDWLQHNEHPHCVFGFGVSMGAAQLLQSLQSETRFCAVVVESPFASFREIGYDRVGQRFNTGPWLGRTILRPIVEFAFLYARLKYQLNFEQISPESAVTRSKVPVLLIHGIVDSNIPVRHSRMILGKNSGRIPPIVLWEVPNADHLGASGAAPGEFEEKVVAWFGQHSGPSVP